MRGHVSRRCGCPTARDDDGRPRRNESGGVVRNHRQGCKPTWQFVHDLPATPGAKRRQKTKAGFATKRDAERALSESISALTQGVYEPEGHLTTGRYLSDWLAGKAGIRETTKSSYESHLRLYLVPALGAVRLAELRHHHIEAMFVGLRSRPQGAPAAGTQHRIRATLTSALNDAVKRRLILFNPARTIEMPRVKRTAISTWSPCELRGFLERTAEHRLGAAFWVAALTGMRRGEIAGLRWGDVDLAAGRLRVTNQRVELRGGTVDCEPKSYSGAREIGLDLETVKVLTNHRRSWLDERVLYPGQTHDYVFTGPSGGQPVRPEYLYRALQAAIASCGLPQIRLHDLRHTHATHALEAGVPMKVVQDRLGHSSMVLTADTYSHVQRPVADAAAQTIADLVLSDSSGPQLSPLISN